MFDKILKGLKDNIEAIDKEIPYYQFTGYGDKLYQIKEILKSAYDEIYNIPFNSNKSK